MQNITERARNAQQIKGFYLKKLLLSKFSILVSVLKQ